MTAALIEQAAADGVRLALTPAGNVKATGDAAAVARWLPAIREHKPALVAALASPDALPRRAWLLHFAEREPLEVIFCPEQSHAEVLARYPEAIAAQPVPQPEPAPDPLPADDRVRCEDCAKLSTARGRDGFRHCRAEARRYCPAPDVPRRCPVFVARARPTQDDRQGARHTRVRHSSLRPESADSLRLESPRKAPATGGPATIMGPS